MQKERLFEKTLFRRMFFSYVLLIFLCVVFYTLTLIYETHMIREERVERKTTLMMEEVDRIIRERIIKAQNTVTELNYSVVLKRLYLNKISGMPIDSYNYVDIKDEISKSKITSGLSIAGTMIFLNNDRNAYTSSGMITLGEKTFVLPDLEMPYYGVNTVKDVLGFTDSKRYSFRKEYFLYLDYFTYQNGTNVGLICILFDLDTIEKEIQDILAPGSGIRIFLRGQEILSTGQPQGMRYSLESNMIPEMSITLTVSSKDSLSQRDLAFYVILFMLLAASLLFVLLAYRFSRKNYRVIGDIEKLVHSGDDKKNGDRLSAEEESSSIIREIEKMIVENTGYQEKMVTIMPYAKTGMLHGMLTGDITGDMKKILKEEKYLNLMKEFFVVTVVNFYYSGEWEDPDTASKINELLNSACTFFSSEETKVECYYKDIFNIFLIVSTDIVLSDDYFYNIHKYLTDSLTDPDYQVTMGVDKIRDDITELRDAYEGAMCALDNIIMDGRGMVYFQEETFENAVDCYFPRTFHEALLKALKAGDKEEVRAILQKIYDKNAGLSGSSKTYHALVDELYVSITKVLKTFSENTRLHINVEKYTGIATLKEIFDYYEEALMSIMDSFRGENEGDRKGSDLEKEILRYIDENYSDPELSMQRVMDEFRISAGFLGDVCKKYHGLTYLQYLQKRRIEKAVALLESGKYSLGQISSMCGYINQLTFRRNFKAVTKVNPSFYMSSDKDSFSD